MGLLGLCLFLTHPVRGAIEGNEGLDGQHFKLSEKQFGVNFPPVHPNCRCTTVGWEPEEKELPEGEQQEEISYEEWYGKYVEGRGKNLIANKQVSEPFVDVTNEYLLNATPNVGNIEFGINFVPANYPEEVSFANWIHRALGGNIKILAETKTSKIADYIWNGKLWDLKTATTEKSANGLIRKGLKQIAQNPGGIFLDYGSRNISLDALEECINKRMQWHNGFDVDIMVIQNGKITKVLRYKK